MARISLAPDRIPMEPDRTELRRLLTDSVRLGERVARWTRRTFPTTSPHAVDLVRCLVSDNCHLPTGSSRSFRRWLRTDGLPPPHWWERTGRCLRGILWLQRNPSETLISAALRVGFSEASGFSRACVTYLGERPGSLRRLMGWQWILWNALTRAE